MTKSVRRKSQPATGNLKSELVSVAVGMLEAEGADALSLRMVARAAGVSHMAPYRHFENKDALLAAVAETGFRDLVSSIDEALSQENVDAQKSRAIGIAYVRFAQRRPALYRLMFGRQLSDETQFPGLAEALSQAQARCFMAVSLLSPNTSPRSGDKAEKLGAETLGVAIWSLVHGLANLLIDGQLDLLLEDEAEDTLIEGVLDILERVAQTGDALPLATGTVVRQ